MRGFRLQNGAERAEFFKVFDHQSAAGINSQKRILQSEHGVPGTVAMWATISFDSVADGGAEARHYHAYPECGVCIDFERFSSRELEQGQPENNRVP